MFAVKGWSVSADKLKPEVAGASVPADGPSADSRKSKKRKRQSEKVTSTNVVDLWEKVIEKKEPQTQNGKTQPPSKEKKDKKKRQKLDSVNKTPSKKEPDETKKDQAEGAGEEDSSKPKSHEKLPKKDKGKGKKDKQKSKEAKDATTTQQPSSKDILPPAAPVPAPPKLTPLQASMREKLISARFRHLNETLYTRPSAEAYDLFQGSPEMFTEYHEGFRRQVGVWPENPVVGYIADVRQRARARSHHPKDNRRNNKKPQEQDTKGKDAVQPLPRNRATGLCTIADLGCGDARLASELQAEKAKLKVEILSYDLYSPHPLVTKADIASLPLRDGSVDVAIFCLALMGTNWVDFIEEAYRILRWKGELWVAEIKSRFGHVGGAGGKKGGVVEHSVGNRRKPGAAGKKAGKGGKDDGAANEAALLVEVDGVDDTRQETDVSAFVEVLNKRGFLLEGQGNGSGPGSEAIDLSNRMFVKMRFVKAAPAVKGKCVRKEEERPAFGGKPGLAKKPKFIDADDDNEGAEAAVLKPCLYKIR